jgi:hypothetical protein
MSCLFLGESTATILAHWGQLAPNHPKIPLNTVELGLTYVSNFQKFLKGPSHTAGTQVIWAVYHTTGNHLDFTSTNFRSVKDAVGETLRLTLASPLGAEQYAMVESYWLENAGGWCRP